MSYLFGFNLTGGEKVDIFSSTRLLERGLNVASLQQRVIAENIANEATPFYKRKTVSFEDQLQKALTNTGSLKSQRTNSKHIPFSTELSVEMKPKIQTHNSNLFNHNGNNVDMDYEMVQLAKNQIWYSALTDRINGRLQSLKTVIKEGR